MANLPLAVDEKGIAPAAGSFSYLHQEQAGDLVNRFGIKPPPCQPDLERIAAGGDVSSKEPSVLGLRKGTSREKQIATQKQAIVRSLPVPEHSAVADVQCGDSIVVRDIDALV